MIRRGLTYFGGKRVLLLQGPLGPFFKRLDKDLSKAGADVLKVDFNGGDWLFSPAGSIKYRGTVEDWPHFCENLIKAHGIDVVMLFGDCRIYHVAARAVARRLGLEIGVLEEGYVRPDYITLEREGVNGFSPLPASPIFYLNKAPQVTLRTDPVGNTFWHAAGWAFLYYLAAILLRPFFPFYQHHRALGVAEAGVWLRAACRKQIYRRKEQGIAAVLTGRMSRQFFLVPLQVHNDAQILVHSPFSSVEEFIDDVVRSFAAHGPQDTALVIKHHPMDRGYRDYTGMLDRLREATGLGHRLLYIHDQHLPSLLNHARGVVVVNSTVGMSALYHKAALKVCGQAIYNFKGLVYQGGLDSFWADADTFAMDQDLFDRFRSYLIEQTQLNGSFYKRLPGAGSYAGVRWEERPAAKGEARTAESAFSSAPAHVTAEPGKLPAACLEN